MTNKIEQIIDTAICDTAEELHISQVALMRREILSTLDAAGLAVRPKNPQQAQLEAMRFNGYSGQNHANYCAAIAAFDPTTYEPEPTE